MLLVIDVGNSHTVAGLYRGDELLGHWRLKSDRAKTDDEIAVHYHALFSMLEVDTLDINGVILASVVPTLENSWKSCCRKYFFKHLQDKIFVVSAECVRDMIGIKLPRLDEVGADRLVNGIAAYKMVNKPLIVIDFGTAITFDCVNHHCEYIGGAIMPGVAISLDALSSRTAKLPHIDVSRKPDSVIGTTTVEAMNIGVVHGYGSMIDGMVEKISEEMMADGSEQPVVVATGGMASVIAPATSSITHVDQLLTLKGLKYIYETKVIGC